MLKDSVFEVLKQRVFEIFNSSFDFKHLPVIGKESWNIKQICNYFTRTSFFVSEKLSVFIL